MPTIGTSEHYDWSTTTVPLDFFGAAPAAPQHWQGCPLTSVVTEGDCHLFGKGPHAAGSVQDTAVSIVGKLMRSGVGTGVQVPSNRGPACCRRLPRYTCQHCEHLDGGSQHGLRGERMQASHAVHRACCRLRQALPSEPQAPRSSLAQCTGRAAGKGRVCI